MWQEQEDEWFCQKIKKEGCLRCTCKPSSGIMTEKLTTGQVAECLTDYYAPWYKHPEDATMPSKKNDKLARHFMFCGQRDLQVK